LKEEKGVSNV